MRSIYKFIINPDQWNLPNKSGKVTPLSVGVQGDNICLWGLVDDSKPANVISIYHAVTGNGSMEHIPSDAQFIGTAQLPDGIVIHIFWREIEATGKRKAS